MLAVLINYFSPYFWRKDLSQNLELTGSAGLGQPMSSRNLWVSAGVTDMYPHTSFYLCAGDLNTGPHEPPSSHYLKSSGSPVSVFNCD